MLVKKAGEMSAFLNDAVNKAFEVGTEDWARIITIMERFIKSMYVCAIWIIQNGTRMLFLVNK